MRTTNLIESIFAGVRRSAAVAKRIRRRANALDLMFKIAQRLSRKRLELNGGPTRGGSLT